MLSDCHAGDSNAGQAHSRPREALLINPAPGGSCGTEDSSDGVGIHGLTFLRFNKILFTYVWTCAFEFSIVLMISTRFTLGMKHKVFTT